MPCLIDMQMDYGSSKLGITSPVTDIIERWIQCIEEYPESSPNKQRVNNLLKEREVPFVAASTENSFRDLCHVQWTKCILVANMQLLGKKIPTRCSHIISLKMNVLVENLWRRNTFKKTRGRLPGACTLHTVH